MANNFLDDVGLSYLWGKIKSTFATKQYVQNAIAGMGGSSGDGGSGVPLVYLTDEEIDAICSYTLENYLESIASEKEAF